jgi:hypothetical protein
MLLRVSCFVFSLLILAVCISMPKVSSAASDDERLNRLFMNPETRSRIDGARKGDPVMEKSEKGAATSKIRIDGVVLRENGDNVVWVNGKSSLNSNNISGAQVRTQRIDRMNYRVPVKVDDQTVRLKPGQEWSEESGKVSDER